MKKLYLIAVVAILLVVLNQRHLSSVIYNNIGRIIWLRDGDDEQSTIAAALSYFERGIASNPRYPQARIGAALANILIGNEDTAFAHWDAGGIDSSILIAYGDKEINNGDFNRALLFYKDSARLTKNGSRVGYTLAGNVCRHAFYGPGLLSHDNQDFCRAYFSDNPDSLIVNANFNRGDLTGWIKRYWSGFSGSYLVKYEGDDDTDVAIIRGVKDKEVGAISQLVTFQAGTIVRFSARIKAELQNDAKVRLLHVVWTQPDGGPGGNQLATIETDMDWAYLERTLRLPQAEGGSFTFSPAILTGSGDVWIDDVHLEIISEN